MKEPLCLLINDIHVNKNNIAEFNANWNEALEVCRERGIEDIVIGGDLWETRSGQTLNTLLAVKHALLKAVQQGVYVTIAEGNHCKVDQEEIEGYSHIFSEYKNIKCVDTHEIITWEGVDDCLAVMSYFPESGTFVERLEELEGELKKRDILLSTTTLYIHQGIQGGLPGGFVAPSDLPVDIFEKFKQVLVGHYHNQSHIKDTNIWYIGSSRQKDFGEDENKGYTIFFDDGSIKFVQNQINIRYKNVELDYKQLQDFDCKELKDPKYKVKLKLNCSETQLKNLDRNALKERGFTRIEATVTKKEKSLQQSSLEVKYDATAIREEYVNFCKQEKINSTLGEKYLDKIN